MRSKNKARLYRSVKEAIDSYPGGLCFSEAGGRPILVNHIMNSLVSKLTGHTVLNADMVWSEISAIESRNGCTKLNEPWFSTNRITIDKNSLIFRFPDERIWHFRRQRLSEDGIGSVQTETSEITELYSMSHKLYENNLQLDQLRKRQVALLENIVEINREKELLGAKMKIHDDLGKCIVAAKKYLSLGEASDTEYFKLIKSWSDAISNMENVPLQGVNTSGEEELDKVADLIGCRIIYTGEAPAERGARLLLYSAVREALTNAVRHGGASELTVTIDRDENAYLISISNNGRQPAGRITESGGLINLRRLLEQEGALLTLSYDNGYALNISIPK